jgi:hypothetical protein
MYNDKAHHVRVRAVVAYPAISVALVVSAAFALGPSPVMAFAATPTPTATTGLSAPPSPTPTATTALSASLSPTPTATTAPSANPATSGANPATSGATPSPTAIASASSGSAVPSGGPVDHHVLARIEGSGLQARYLAVDASITDASQFQTLRLRFKMHNAGTAAVTAAPQLEYRANGSTGYTVVPEALLKGIPFRVDREWVPNAGPGGGTKQGPLGEDIAVAKFLTGNEGGGLAMTGHHSMGANPDQQITLPPDSYTEQEFTVQVTMDAKYLTGYDFRITNGRTMLAGSQVATVSLGLAPALQLSPGQHKGVAVDGPKPTIRTGVSK